MIALMVTMRTHLTTLCTAILLHYFWFINGENASTAENGEISTAKNISGLKISTPPKQTIGVTLMEGVSSITVTSTSGKEESQSAVTHKSTDNKELTVAREESSVSYEFPEYDTSIMRTNESRRAEKIKHKHHKTDSEEREILRYGKFKLSQCMDYEKQYICSRRCVDTGYDEGRTDKNCRCICYKEKGFKQYTATEKHEEETTLDEKVILRHGIHKLSRCKDYKKQYICTRKCLDTGFDVGHTDKDCRCTCYKTKDFMQYTTPRTRNLTKWTSGAPRTTRPHWALPKLTTENVQGEGESYGPFRCDYNYNASGGGWFKLHYMMNWTDANATCSKEGAELVSPNSISLKEATLAIIQRDGLIGVHTRRPVPTANKTDFCEILSRTGVYQTVHKSDAYPFICYKKDDDLVLLSECGTVDREYKRPNATGDRCYKFHSTFATWCEALSVCVAEGAYLTVINNQDELKNIKKALDDKWEDFYTKNKNDTLTEAAAKSAFVGIWSVDSGRNWITVQGGKVSDTNFDKWNPGRPDKQSNISFCGKIDKKESSYLDDPCDNKASFICEKTPSSSDICNNPIEKPKLDAIFRKCSMYFGT